MESIRFANEVKNLFYEVKPFSKFKLDIDVHTIGKKICVEENAYRYECPHSLSDLVGNALLQGAKQVMVVGDREKGLYLHSKNGIPIINSDDPAALMIHEYLHVLGFSDEYEEDVKDPPRRYIANQRKVQVCSPRWFDAAHFFNLVYYQGPKDNMRGALEDIVPWAKVDSYEKSEVPLFKAPLCGGIDKSLLGVNYSNTPSILSKVDGEVSKELEKALEVILQNKGIQKKVKRKPSSKRVVNHIKIIPDKKSVLLKYIQNLLNWFNQ